MLSNRPVSGVFNRTALSNKRSAQKERKLRAPATGHAPAIGGKQNRARFEPCAEVSERGAGVELAMGVPIAVAVARPAFGPGAAASRARDGFATGGEGRFAFERYNQAGDVSRAAAFVCDAFVGEQI